MAEGWRARLVLALLHSPPPPPCGLFCLQGWDGAEATPHGQGSYQCTGTLVQTRKRVPSRWQTQPVLEGGLGLVHSLPPAPRPPQPDCRKTQASPASAWRGAEGAQDARRRDGGS